MERTFDFAGFTTSAVIFLTDMTIIALCRAAFATLWTKVFSHQESHDFDRLFFDRAMIEGAIRGLASADDVELIAGFKGSRSSLVYIPAY